MAKVAKHITELIGHTPLLELSNWDLKLTLLQNLNILIHWGVLKIELLVQ